MDMMKKTFCLFMVFVFFALTAVSAKKKFTLVIDPGHGGHDAGAIGAFSKEKDINLNIALAFGEYIEHNLSDVRVIYTRKNDVFVSLKGRADIANQAKADLFISVHTNSVPVGKVAPQGFQVYTLGMHRAKDNLDVAIRENAVISLEKNYEQTYEGFDPRSSESYIMFEFLQSANMARSVELAKYIQRSVCRTAYRNDKGVHQAGFLVLRETSMPSCLIELGFITSPEEEEFLNSTQGINLMARGIYEAFVQYKNQYDDHIVIPYRSNSTKQFTATSVLPKVNSRPVVPSEKPKIQRKATPATKQKNKETKVKTETKKPAAPKENPNAPVFKLQVFAINRQLRPGSEQFKGYNDITSFVDGNLYKYTIGSSTNYNEIYRLRKKILKDFPQAYIIAFKNGKPTNVNDAIKEFLQNKK